MEKFSIGVDIGGTKCAVVLGGAAIPETPEDFIRDRVSFDTPIEKGPAHTIREICAAIDSLLDRHGLPREGAVGIGVSCGGPLNHREGVILSPPNLYGWDNVPIVQMIGDHFGIPVRLQNDANACALAEWRFGAARGCDNVVFLTFGTGMGAGLILDGRLYNGAGDMAGEVGHIRLAEFGPVGYGKAGSFEGFCSGGGIAQLAKIMVLEQLQLGICPAFCPDLDSLNTLSAKTVAQAAEAGDELALEIYRASGRYLGRGLAILVDILNPEIIVIGSIYERSEDLLWPSVQPVLEREALGRSLSRCRIVPARLGNRLGDFAALSVALQGEQP